MNFKFYNIDYTLDDKNTIKSFAYYHPNYKNLKETLFRYCQVTKNSVESLSNNKFYATQPDEFNDLFDFNINLLDFSNFTLKEILAECKTSNSKKEIIQKFNSEPKSVIKEYQSIQRSILLSKFGILCLTHEDLSDLMWGYYGNNSGFQVEYEYKKFTDRFLGPFPLNYVSSLKKIDVSKIGGPMAFMVQATAKKECWQHESEWRFFLLPDEGQDFKVTGNYSNANIKNPYSERFVNYPPESIKSITLGFKFFEKCPRHQIKQNQYVIKLQSIDSQYRISLLEFILKNDIPCFIIYQNSSSFQLEKGRIKFFQMFDDTFLIETENLQKN